MDLEHIDACKAVECTMMCPDVRNSVCRLTTDFSWYDIGTSDSCFEEGPEEKHDSGVIINTTAVRYISRKILRNKPDLLQTEHMWRCIFDRRNDRW